MKIIEIKTSLLKDYKNNPRHNEKAVEMVAQSIRDFGFRNPIIIDKDNVIVCGHTRKKAAELLGIEVVPCIMADDLTDDQIKAFRLVDNRTNEIAMWDFEKLEDELKDISMNLDAFNFDFENMKGFEDFGEETKEQQEITEDETPEIDEENEPITKLGDIWQLGGHRLMCGDSTDKETVAKLMDGKKADLVFTDPPYGMNLDTDYSGMKNNLDIAKSKNFKGGNKYEQGNVDNFAPDMIKSIIEIGAKETFIWGANYFAELLPNRNNGSWIVWDKRANSNDDIEKDYSSDKMYGSCFELCWSKCKHKQDIARIKWAGVFGTEQEFDHKRYHPTQKPIKLVEWFLIRYSKEGDEVCDLFGGSGSTLIACEQLNRKCYMVELDPKYCDVIIKRWETLTGNKAVLLNETSIKGN